MRRRFTGKPLDAGGLKSKPGVTAERLYSNQKVTDLVAKAETEQNDYRRMRAINVFFSPEKHYDLWFFGHYYMVRVSVLTYATGVLVGSSLLLMSGLYGVLKRQLRTEGC